MELTKQQIKQVERLTGFKRLTEEQFRKLVYKAAKEYNKQFGYTEEFEEQESKEIVDSVIQNEWKWMKDAFIKTDWAGISTSEGGYLVLDAHVLKICTLELEFEYTAMCSGDPISMAFPLKWIIGLSKIFGHLQDDIKEKDEA